MHLDWTEESLEVSCAVQPLERININYQLNYECAIASNYHSGNI